MKKGIGIALLLATLAIFPGYATVDAMQNVMTSQVALRNSRQMFTLRGTDKKVYRVYILGENERYGKNVPGWQKTKYDQLYVADGYYAYVEDLNSGVAVFQSTELFGKRKGYTESVNLTDPTYGGGFYVIRGMNGEPDILVSAMQMTGNGHVDYRFFVVKNGMLKQMKLLNSSKETFYKFVGHHKRPYMLDDGTIALPWFKRGQGSANPGGLFTSVYMTDFTNLILMFAYTYKEE